MPERIRRRPDAVPNPALAEVHPVLASVFASRGIASVAETAYTLDSLLPPAQMHGLEAAGKLLADCVQQQLKILVVGDFDADGATSTALAITTLRAMGARDPAFLVPNRFEFGYGLTPEIVELAATQQPALIVTVDNGISSLEGVALARSLGIRTLVTDHHLPGLELPQADVIVNPNQPDCQFPSKNLAGVGVIFYVMSALRSELVRRHWFEKQGLVTPNLADVLDLVALGTVADVVPLDYNNRILVEQGMRRIRAGKTRPGIQALLEIASRPGRRLVASDLSFGVAPRLNAAGRLDDMSTGIACLLAPDDSAARHYGQQLDALNRDRQQIEKGMQQEAMQILDRVYGVEGDDIPAALCLYEPDWHQGVVGIVASRVKDKVHRPVIAFARADDGVVKGSARSIPGLHIRDALERVNTLHPGLIDKFGGHAMAAGLSLAEDSLELFRQSFTAVVAQLLDGVELEAVVESDGELPSSELGLTLATQLRYASPWGQHFPEPIFDGVFTIVTQRLVGERHLKLVVHHPDDPRNLLDAIAFNVDLQTWPSPELAQVRLAYRLDCNYFRGEERLQLLVDHLQVLD
jgi:single-stranded-DNA-specific exonuclease